MLRPWQQNDGPFIFYCRNDPWTRAMSKRHGLIPWGEVRTWRPSVWEIDGIAMGYCRLDHNKAYVDLSYVTAPFCRGKGVATAMIQAATALCKLPVVAEIRRDNVASMKACVRAGLKLVNGSNEYVMYSNGGIGGDVRDAAQNHSGVASQL